MNLPPITADPRLAPYTPAAERSLTVFGAPVLLAYLPSRRQRQDRPGATRPAFRPSPVPRILAEESMWQGDGVALTPNRYPFAREQRLLWSVAPRREPDLAMWTSICGWADACDGTVLVNNIGSAASIARAHAHLTPERMPFLDTFAERPAPTGLIDVPDGVELVVKGLPFCLLGVRGPAAARALAIERFAEARLTSTWNVIATGGTAWLCPRRSEMPEPDFPYPLGSSELWGRWCYIDPEPFDAATGAMLERALLTACAPPL